MSRSRIPTLLVRSPITTGYKPPSRTGLAAQIRDGRPWLTWSNIEAMRRDPQVSMGLRILRAPIAQAKIRAVADDMRVAQFVDMQVKRFWKNSLGHALTAFDYGNSAAEPTYALQKGLQVFNRLRRLHLNDTRPLEYSAGVRHGEFAGLRVSNLSGGDRSGDLVTPWCWWFALDPEPGQLIGRSRLHGCHEPWLEKRGRHGAIDSRRLYFHKSAFTGGVIRYPEGSTNMGSEESPNYVSNQSIAREVLEKFENGGILTLPNTRDPDNGNYLWEVTFAQYLGGAPALLEYPDKLDKEILKGLGIPPELVEASTVGSGYSGRAIPAQMFFSSLDEVVLALMEALIEQILRPLVVVNFGRKAWFDLEADSLAEMVARDAADAGKATQGDDSPDVQDPLAAAMQAAKNEPLRMSMQKLAKRLGKLAKAPAPEPKVKVYPVTTKPYRVSSKLAARVKKLAAQRYPDLSAYERTDDGTWRLSWSAARTRSGAVKAVGSGDHEGQTLYGDDAKRALTQKKDKPKEADPAEAADVAALTEKIPSEFREKAVAFYAAVKGRALQAVTTVLANAHELAPQILDTVDDFNKISYHKAGDAILAHTGIPANTLAVVASHVLSRALNAMGIRLSQQPTQQQQDAAKLVTDVMRSLNEAFGIADLVELPADADVLAKIVAKTGAADGE